MPPPLILASGSSARATLLRGARIAFSVAPPQVDEDAAKALALTQGRTPPQVAMLLAQAKSLAVSAAQSGALVIGADQVLEIDGALLSKAPDLASARAQLTALAGRTHSLLSAVCVARDGAIVWRHLGEARMTMRRLAEGDVERYVQAAGEAILSSVGAYHFEGLGAHLFDAVEGDQATIVGLPLLPLLGFLRTQGISFS